jgi:protease-4
MLNAKQIRDLATGQIFTSNQAKEKKLIDKIGYVDDAVEALKTKLQLSDVRVVKYESSQSLLETLLSSRTSDARPQSQLSALLEAAVPRAYYLFSTTAGFANPAR